MFLEVYFGKLYILEKKVDFQFGVKNNLNLLYMKLLELVKYFRSGGSYENFCNEQLLDPDSEIVEIYMEEPLDINGNLGFFEIEKTEGAYEFFKATIPILHWFKNLILKLTLLVINFIRFIFVG